jgi:hypothetical protein
MARRFALIATRGGDRRRVAMTTLALVTYTSGDIQDRHSTPGKSPIMDCWAEERLVSQDQDERQTVLRLRMVQRRRHSHGGLR